jgi:hypothetical protein
MEIEGNGLVSAMEKVWAENKDLSIARYDQSANYKQQKRSATSMKKLKTEGETEEEEEVLHHYSAADSNNWVSTDMQYDEVHNNIILYIYIV